MKKVEHVTFQTQTRSEQFATPLFDLQQLDSLKNSLTELEDEEILCLKTRVAECGVEIKELERGISTLLELRSVRTRQGEHAVRSRGARERRALTGEAGNASRRQVDLREALRAA